MMLYQSWVLSQMDCSTAKCPQWLADRIVTAGGIISFFQYMDWVLNDPEHGAYSRGNLIIGKEGDFATSPSLGPDFAELLAVQLVSWLEQLVLENVDDLPLSIIEVGPGEGDLAFETINARLLLSISNLQRIHWFVPDTKLMLFGWIIKMSFHNISIIRICNC